MELRITHGRVRLAGREILSGVDLALRPGRLVGVLGPNGAGKSTLLRALAGIAPLAAGRIDLGGRPLARFSRRGLARRIAYLPQEPGVPPAFAAGEVVLMGRYPLLRRLRGEGGGDQRAVSRALELVDAGALRHRSLDELSGGERQRVLVARTLVAETPVLLLDEPAAGLDIRHVLDLLELLSRQARSGRTVAVALHDLDLAYRYCDRLVVVCGGRLAAKGAAQEVLTVDLVRRVFGVELGIARWRARGTLVFEKRACAGARGSAGRRGMPG